MSDPTDMATLATTGGAAVSSSALVAAFMRWLSGREAAEVRTQLALVQQKLDQVAQTLEKHADLGERVALLEASVKALHARLDGKRGRR